MTFHGETYEGTMCEDGAIALDNNTVEDIRLGLGSLSVDWRYCNRNILTMTTLHTTVIIC